MESKKLAFPFLPSEIFYHPPLFATQILISPKKSLTSTPPLPLGITKAKYQDPEKQENVEFIRPSQIDSMDDMLPREDVRMNASTHFKLISISLLFVESITFYWILIQLHQTEWAAISPIHITGKSTRSHASFDG